MGWFYSRPNFYKADGSVDRKAEMDNGFSAPYTVLKSAMVSSVYYAAIRNEETQDVIGYVALTTTNTTHQDGFGYKPISEDMFPSLYDCPVGILKLLTPTTNMYANLWRKRCWAELKLKRERKKSPKAFANLPDGAVVLWSVPRDFIHSVFPPGEVVRLVKGKPNSKAKRSAWLAFATGTYLHACQICVDEYVLEVEFTPKPEVAS